MSTRVVDRVEEWSEQPFEDGYSGLQQLADREFSGVVRTGGAELYMANGVAIGVRNGDISTFETAGGTAHAAPSPALPVLAIMQERSDEVREEFYSEQTPLAEVNETLASGGFSGYIELSENVLSGDYYVVYHAGRSMSVAFVGQSGQLIEGQEAFEQAREEVGIYQVRPTSIDPLELPEPPAPTRTKPADTHEGTDESGPDAGDGGGDSSDDTVQKGSDEGDSGSGWAGTPEARGDEGLTGTGEETESVGGSTPEKGNRVDEDTVTTDPDSHEGSTEGSGGEASDRETDEPVTSPPAEGTVTSETDGAADTDTDDEETIPSVDQSRRDPETSAEEAVAASSETAGPEAGDDESAEREGGSSDGREDTAVTAAEFERETTEHVTPEEEAAESVTDDRMRLARLEGKLEERESEMERLRSELAARTAERDDLQAELESVRHEREQLQTRVAELEAERDHLESTYGVATDPERTLTPTEALDGTDIFLRYRKKDGITLASVTVGEGTREELRDNLDLELHTSFDTESVAVEGRTYDAFLEETLALEFVEWLVTDLAFEIREAGAERALADLYGVLSTLDRAELQGVVQVGDGTTGEQPGREDTEPATAGQGAETESFDVVFRNRAGTPVLVANLHDSREAVQAPTVERTLTAAERVGRTVDPFSGTFQVTRSFFEPAAIDVVEGATKSGILSRDKRSSFVNLSRKRGYHLGLVEAREGAVHLVVPEL